MALSANMPTTSKTCAKCFSAFSGKGRAVYCAECADVARRERQAGYDKARGSRARSGRAIPTVPCKGGCGTLVVGAALHGPTYCTVCRTHTAAGSVLDTPLMGTAVSQGDKTVGNQDNHDIQQQVVAYSQQPCVPRAGTWECMPCYLDGIALGQPCPACGQEPPCASF